MARNSPVLRPANFWSSNGEGPLGFSRAMGMAVTVAAAVLIGLAAVPVANAGLKGFVAAAGGLGFLFMVMLVRDRALFGLFTFIVGLQFLLHKAFTDINETIHSGPNSLYISSADVLLGFVVLMWLLSGRLSEDLARARQRSEIVVPFVAGLLFLPSVLLAGNLTLAVAELFRMALTFLLFLCVALRVRDRRELLWILIALAAIVVGQFVIVMLQLRAGGTLGFELLGEELQMTPRVLDDNSVIIRPSGTVIHPNLLGALVGPIGLIFLSLAIYLRPMMMRAVCGGLGVAVMGILAISQTRASILGMAAGAVMLVMWTVWHRRLKLWVVGAAVMLLAIGSVPYWNRIVQRIEDNIGTRQFNKEIQARIELNDVALNMILDRPLLGFGLNNFEQDMDPYQSAGLIFANNPVHNIYLLFASESGVVAALGFLATQLVLLSVALRLSLSRDRLLAGIGAGVAAVHVFFMTEEMLMFSLRIDMPRMLYWLLIGLSVACWRLHIESHRRMRGEVAHVQG